MRPWIQFIELENQNQNQTKPIKQNATEVWEDSSQSITYLLCKLEDLGSVSKTTFKKSGMGYAHLQSQCEECPEVGIWHAMVNSESVRDPASSNIVVSTQGRTTKVVL